MRRAVLVVLAIVTAVATAVVWPSSASAAGTGQVKITFSTPSGVPATVELKGPAPAAAAKPAAGRQSTTTLTLPPGQYDLEAQQVVVRGVLYAGFFLQGSTTVRRVSVQAGAVAQVAAVYVAPLTASNVTTTSVTGSSISLAWTSPENTAFTVRRTTGQNPASTPSGGVAVPVSGGTSATDTGLTPGTQYTYTLFPRTQGAAGTPYSLTVGTAPPSGSTDAAFAKAPGTLIATPEQIAAITPTGDGLRVAFAPGVPSRVVGTAVVLPVSEALPGGYLGVVTSISSDGRAAQLAPGGIGDAFTYYEINIPDISAETTGQEEAGVFGALEAPQESAVEQLPPADPSQRTPLDTDTAGDEEPSISAAAVGIQCTTAVTTAAVEPSLSLQGSFSAKIETNKFFGADIPTGRATFDMSIKAVLDVVVSISANASGSCTLQVPEISRQLTAYPVPLAAVFSPTATLDYGAGISANSFGFTAAAGVNVGGTIDPTNQSISASPIASASLIQPQISASGQAGLTLGGSLGVGPGGAAGKVGVVALVKGTLTVLDADASVSAVATPSGVQTCIEATAGWAAGLSLQAKAWLGKWSTERTFTHPSLQTSGKYGSSPWSYPQGCDSDATPTAPAESVLGQGVSQVSEQTTGNPTQMGYVQGFVPGQRTWVVSSGLASAIPGSPSTAASFEMGLAGDPVLDQLSGRPTYDAASYQVTVVPTGTTLYVRYAFASEEYPEYVGSSYNDVMAVLVNGQNCALIPGTNTPVSINTVNAFTNSAYYIDNSSGASGYNTVMDGLTRPLTCAVPVTPGSQVTVRIAVADASDRILDSAVALLDGGIWSA